MDTNNKITNMNKDLLEAVKSVLKGAEYTSPEHKKDPISSLYVNLKETREQLDELSKETLTSYKNKAEADPAFEKKKGPTPKATKLIRNKRLAGLENAAKKLGEIRKKEFEERFGKSQAKNEDLHKHFHKEAPKILAKHGYTKASENDKRATYVRPHETGHVTTVTLHKKTPELGAASHDFGSSINMSSRHNTHDGKSFMDADEHAKQKREMMPKFEAAVIKHHSDDWHWGHVNESFNLGVFSDAELETLDTLITEDFEQLDEISKKTLGSYIKKASGTFDHERNTPGRVATSAEDARRYITDPKNDPYYGSNGNEKIYNKIGKKLSNRRSGINKALDRLTKEEVEQIDELSKKTLGSYVNRALNGVRNSNQAIGRRDQGDTWRNSNPNLIKDPEQREYHKHNLKIAKKREKGIRTAVDKLTKEELELLSADELQFLDDNLQETNIT